MGTIKTLWTSGIGRTTLVACLVFTPIAVLLFITGGFYVASKIGLIGWILLVPYMILVAVGAVASVVDKLNEEANEIKSKNEDTELVAENETI